MSDVGSFLTQLNALGVFVEANGNNLCIDAPQGVMTPEILESVRQRKAEVLAFLSSWPKKCLDAERRFGHQEARLYPLIGKRVVTPKGAGVLERVFEGSIGVALDSDPNKVTFFEKPEEIYPDSSNPGDEVG